MVRITRGFQEFRVDRMLDVAVLVSQFGNDAGKTLSDYLQSWANERQRCCFK